MHTEMCGFKVIRSGRLDVGVAAQLNTRQHSFVGNAIQVGMLERTHGMSHKFNTCGSSQKKNAIQRLGVQTAREREKKISQAVSARKSSVNETSVRSINEAFLTGKEREIATDLNAAWNYLI